MRLCLIFQIYWLRQSCLRQNLLGWAKALLFDHDIWQCVEPVFNKLDAGRRDDTQRTQADLEQAQAAQQRQQVQLSRDNWQLKYFSFQF